MKLPTLTDSVDFVRQLSGTEGARVLGDALVKQVDDVAIPTSLHKREDIHHLIRRQRLFPQCTSTVYVVMNLGCRNRSSIRFFFKNIDIS